MSRFEVACYAIAAALLLLPVVLMGIGAVEAVQSVAIATIKGN